MSTSEAQGLTRVIRNLRQFVKFGIVGGSGTVVNLVVVYITKKALELGWGIREREVFLPLLGTDFNIRWYNVITIIAFLVANTWNYQLNRMWTFKSVSKVSWLRGFLPFLFTGLGALVVQQIALVLLMNPNSPLGLPEHILDDTTGFRTKFYWATAISIFVAMPVNFVINKLWTFRSKPKTPRVVADSPPL